MMIFRWMDVLTLGDGVMRLRFQDRVLTLLGLVVTFVDSCVDCA